MPFTPNIKEYKRILDNPYAIEQINQLLKKYGKLDQFYALMGEAVIKMMITVPEELKSLELFSKNICSPLDGTETVFSYWNTAVARAKELSENEIKDLYTDFANSMADNPNSLGFICFIISLL